MRDEGAPERLTVIWSRQARDDVRAIDRDQALQILTCLDRYLRTRTGDLKTLKPPRSGFRLRCGDYRLFFDYTVDAIIEITRVARRRDAYR